MKFSIVYLVLVSFTFLSLTPAGISLAELRADDLELDELDLGLEDEEEESESSKKGSGDEEDEEESGEKEEDEASSEEDSSKSEDEEETSSEDSSNSGDSEEESASSGKKIVAFYFFEDSHALKGASHVAAETALQLANSGEYDYVGTESSLFSGKTSLKSVKKEFEEGKALYADFNADEALEKFQSVLKYLEDNMDKISDMKFLSEVIFYIAASYKLIDEDEKVESYFSTYLSINPDAEPSESEFSSEVISAFNSVKKNRGKVSKGSLKVSCNPDGALVFLDGKIAGMTPVTLRGVREGRHYYRIHRNGYRDAGGYVDVKGGRTASVSETITKHPEASQLIESEKEMKAEFGQASMLRESLEVARELGVDNVLVVNAKIGADMRLTYTGYMVNKAGREFKKFEKVFAIPEKGRAADSASLKEFNKALIDDPYEYKSVSDVFAAEVEMLTSDGVKDDNAGKEKEGTPVYKAWWLWTVVGVVVLAGAGVGTYFALTSGKDGKGGSGATLEINFQ